MSLPSVLSPLVLLPLRLETRFSGAGEDRRLQVRILPDDIHLDGHRAVVTQDEARSTADLLTRIDRASDATMKKGAWDGFWPEHGPGRAAWLASTLRDQPLQGWPGWHLGLSAQDAWTYVDDAGVQSAAPIVREPDALPFSENGPFTQGTSLTFQLRVEGTDRSGAIWHLLDGGVPVVGLRQAKDRLQWVHRPDADAHQERVDSRPCLSPKTWHSVGIHFEPEGKFVLTVDGRTVAQADELPAVAAERLEEGRWAQRLGAIGQEAGEGRVPSVAGGLVDLRLWSHSLSGQDRERLATESVEVLRRRAVHEPALQGILNELRLHAPLGAPGAEVAAPWATQRNVPGQAPGERGRGWNLAEAATPAWSWATGQPIRPPEGVGRAFGIAAGGHLDFEDGSPPTQEDLQFLGAGAPKTWAFWLNVDRRPDSGTSQILGRWSVVEGHGEIPEISVGLAADGRLAFALGVVAADGVRTWTAKSRDALDDGTWRHLAVVLEPEARQLKIIVDGQPDQTFGLPGPPVATARAAGEAPAPSARGWSLYLGDSPHAAPWNDGQGCEAAIADLRVWGRARRPEQIRADRWTPLRGDEPYLLHHILFSGTAAGAQPVDRASRVGADRGDRRTLVLACDPDRALVQAEDHPLWRRDVGQRAWPTDWQTAPDGVPNPADWAEARDKVRLMPEMLQLEGWSWDESGGAWHKVLGHEIRRDGAAVLEWAPIAAQEPEAGDGLRWPFDLEAALRVGLAADISWPEDSPSLHRLLVIGMCDEESGHPQSLAKALAHHSFSRGLEVVPKGRATNHDDDAAIPDQDRAEADAHYQRLFATRPSVEPDADGHELAAALGLTGVGGPRNWQLQTIPGAEARQGAAARAASRAFWAPALGYTLANLFERAEGLTETHFEGLRDFFVNHVRPDGPYPAVRVGRQPYGVLPVTLPELTHEEELGPPAAVFLMRNLRDYWLDRLRSRQNGSPWWRGLRPEETVTDILRERDVSGRCHLRALLSPHALQPLGGLAGLPAAQEDPELRQMLEALVPDGLARFPSGGAWPLGQFLRAPAGPFPTDIATSSEAWQDYFNLMQPGWGPALSLMVRELERRGEAVRTMPLALGMLLLAADLERAWHSSSGSGPGHRGITAWIEGQGASQGTEAASMDVADPPPTGYDDFWDEVDRLGQRPHEELERWLGGILDTASHRLDPWLTGFAAQRRAGRAGTDIRVGAWGWVEDLAPREADARRSWGHVLAPSQPHAVTAGVLAGACADAQRQGTGGGAAPQAVDLSSARVRGALNLLDGLRRDQDLAALLGYRVERGLKDTLGLPDGPVATSELRQAFPRKVSRHSPGDGGDVAPGRVVDGLALIRAWEADRGRVLGHVGSAAQGGVESVCNEAAADLDALTDLLTAEGVHHLLGQQPERAAAAFDSASRGGQVPDRIESLDAQREALEVRHRLGLLFPVTGATLEASGGWEVTPRGELQPDLERYCRRVLGDAAGVALLKPTEEGSAGDLAALGLGALDFVVLSAQGLDERTPLRRRLDRSADGGAAAQPSDALRRRLAVAQTLHALLKGSRPLAPGDLEPEAAAAEEMPSQPALTGRLRDALADMKSVVSAIGDDLDRSEIGGGGVPPIVPQPPVPDPPQLRGTFEAQTIEELLDVGVPDLADRIARLGRLKSNLATLALYGIPEATAPGAVFERARRAKDAAWERIDALEAQIAGFAGQSDPVEGAHLLFGEDLPVIPTFPAAAPPPLQHQDDAELWLDRIAHIRERTRLLQDLTIAAGTVPGSDLHWADGDATLLAVQRQGDSDGPWAGRLKPDDLPRAGSLALCILAAPDDLQAGRWGGVLVDQWEEKIPADREEIAAAYHFDEPRARPPQSILVATDWGRPDEPWNWNRLSAVVRDTLDLVLLREIRPDDLGLLRHLLPLTHLPYREGATSPHLWTGHLRKDAGDG